MDGTLPGHNTTWSTGRTTGVARKDCLDLNVFSIVVFFFLFFDL